MTDFVVRPSQLKGSTTIPASKSHTLRAILFGALGKGKTTIHNYLPSPDTEAMVQACRSLGASVDVFHNKMEIEGLSGCVEGASDVIQANNSGIVLRFMTAVAALGNRHSVITGDHSVRTNRIIEPLLDGLRQLGVNAFSARGNGYAPVVVQGPLQPGHAKIYGSDSQFVSAMLIASAFVDGVTTMEVVDPGEKPWVDLTLSWLDRLGISYVNTDYKHYTLQGKAQYEGFQYDVPGDLSSLAFPVAAALVTHSELCIGNVDMSDVQGDKVLFSVLEKMGACFELDEKQKAIHVKKARHPLVGMELDINDFIDSIAILAVIGCYAEGTTTLTNAAIARSKECDRIDCLTTELRKMGADITALDDGLVIKQSQLRGAVVEAHKDHRLAMALTVAALGATGETRICGVDCIAKTYPGFCSELQKLGCVIKHEIA